MYHKRTSLPNRPSIAPAPGTCGKCGAFCQEFSDLVGAIPKISAWKGHTVHDDLCGLLGDVPKKSEELFWFTVVWYIFN